MNPGNPRPLRPALPSGELASVAPAAPADATHARPPTSALPQFPLDALITFALAEASWATQAVHPTMSESLRKHHEHHAYMNLTIAKRLQQLKEFGVC